MASSVAAGLSSSATTAMKYPYPAAINVANFVSIRLNLSNFLYWETQITALIQSNGLEGFLDGSEEAPLPKIIVNGEEGANPDYKSWIRTDRLVQAWITSTLTEEVIGFVVGLKTFKKVWDALISNFSQNSQAREFELLSQLRYLQKGTSSLSVHLCNFKSICNKLNAIGRPMKDQDKVFALLNGLGADYESFTTSMLKPPIPMYVDLIPLLQSQELWKDNGKSQLNTSMVFFGQKNGNGNGGNKGFKKGNFHLKEGEFLRELCFLPTLIVKME